jgi:hypothetical protein
LLEAAHLDDGYLPPSMTDENLRPCVYQINGRSLDIVCFASG